MKAFISYSHRDEAVLRELHDHLAMLKREGELHWWHDNDILAGGEIDQEISEQIETCDLFIALVSHNFLASNYCYEREMARAMERCEAGGLRIVSIIVEPCDWKSTPLTRFKVLPKDGEAISKWPNRNDAFLNIVEELRRIAREEPVEEPKDTADPGPKQQRPVAGRYRARRQFAQIDRADFREEAFDTFYRFFEESINELNQEDGLKGRFRPTQPNGFSCTVVNQHRSRNDTAYITVRTATDNGFGDIYYSFSENAPENTANGWFNIGADDYEQFLEWTSMSFGNGNDNRLSPRDAVEALWKEFIGQGGIAYE